MLMEIENAAQSHFKVLSSVFHILQMNKVEKEPAAPALHTPSSFAQSFQRRLRSSSFCSGVIR